MKIKALALSMFVAGLGASFALASPGHGHGKPGATTTTSSTVATTTTAATHGKAAHGCKPEVAFVLNGTFVAASGDGFTMKVTHANHHAKGLGSAVTVSTDAKTTIRRKGKLSKLSDFVAGDRLNVQARGCKSQAAGVAQAFVAKRVTGHPASTSEDGDEHTTTSSTTTATSTTTTSTTTTTGA